MKKIFWSLLSLMTTVQILNAQNNWKTLGNTAIPGDFLGTTNSQNLIIKVNNLQKLLIDPNGNFIFNTPDSYGQPKYSFSGSTSDIASSNSEIFTLTHYTQFLSSGYPSVYNIFKIQDVSTNLPSPKPMAIFNVTSNGNVGINMGTNLPQEKLHIHNGLLRISGTNYAGGPMIEFGGTVSTQSADWGIEYGHSTSIPTLHGLNFWKPYGSNNPGNYFLFLADNGNIGIGTDNPGSFKLAVEGKIGAREVKVTLANPWPDYVFNNDYKRNDLESIEKYIKENKHLPGIKSANQILLDGGIELGDMQVKQMEKIEELYLYIIELKKELSVQRAELAELKTVVNNK